MSCCFVSRTLFECGELCQWDNRLVRLGQITICVPLARCNSSDVFLLGVHLNFVFCSNPWSRAILCFIFPLKLYCLNKESGCVTATQNIGFPDANDVKKKRGKSGWLILKINFKMYNLQAWPGRFVQLCQRAYSCVSILSENWNCNAHIEISQIFREQTN